MELYINKITHYLPENTVPNSYFKEVNGLDDEWIYSRTGIKTRTKAGNEENTNTMGIKAVDQAVKTLPFPIEEIDLIIAATYSPYDTVATPAHMVQRRYHIEHAQCLSVSAACSSFINAMEIVQGYFAMGKAPNTIRPMPMKPTLRAVTCGETEQLQSLYPLRITADMILKSLTFIPGDWDISERLPMLCTCVLKTEALVCPKAGMYS